MLESELEHNDTIKASAQFPSSVEAMCLLLEHAMAYEGSVELHAKASNALIAIGSCMPELFTAGSFMLCPESSMEKQLLSHIDLDTREAAAHLLGIVSSVLPIAASSALISEIIASVRGIPKLRFEVHHGALFALGYVTADCVSRKPAIPGALFKTTLKLLVNVINSETATLASIAVQALGHIGLIVALPSLTTESGSVDILVILQERLMKLFKGDDTKAMRKIIISVGHMCVKETSFMRLNIALDVIFSLCRSKVEDILFAAVEALSFLWGSVHSDFILKTNYSLSMASKFLVEDASLSLSKHSHIQMNEPIKKIVMLWFEKQLLKSFLTNFYTVREKKIDVLELYGCCQLQCIVAINHLSRKCYHKFRSYFGKISLFNLLTVFFFVYVTMFHVYV